MKIGIAFSTKNRTDLTRQSLARIMPYKSDSFHIHWMDGSTTDEGKQLLYEEGHPVTMIHEHVVGGPDVAIVYSLTTLLQSAENYTHIALLENDVLVDADWYEPTLALFDNQEGLPIGAVTARSFEDRVCIQRDGYCVLHNAGAGMILFTREAAQIVLNNYRTGWWPENRAVFSQLSGIDIGKFAAFGFNEQMTTADWSFDTILAAHGLATVALTPSKAKMIGQDIAEQGLKYATGNRYSAFLEARDKEAFTLFRHRLNAIRDGSLVLPPVDHLLRTRGGSIIFPHHAERHGGLFSGKWKTRWSQGFGPFMYVSCEDPCLFSMPVFGPCAFHVGGGKILVNDVATHFSTEVDLSGQTEMVTLAVPRDMQTGIVRLSFGPGACLAGIETVYEQPVWKDVTFDYSKLPEVE